MSTKFAVFAMAGTILCGCSSVVETVNSDPFRIGYISPTGQTSMFEDDTEKAVGIISLDATRRVVIVSLNSDPKGKFCAEPPPDVGAALDIKSSLDASAEVTGTTPVTGSVQIGEEVKETLTKLADRTALLDIYRTGVHSLCQYHLNGVFGDDDARVAEEFSKLTEGVLAAYEASAD